MKSYIEPLDKTLYLRRQGGYLSNCPKAVITYAQAHTNTAKVA